MSLPLPKWTKGLEGGTYKPGPYPGTYYLDQSTVKKEPFSGSYQGKNGKVSADLEVDLDEIRPFSPALNIVSGTISDKEKAKKLWTGDAAAAYFRSAADVKVTTEAGKHSFEGNVTGRFSSGHPLDGKVSGQFVKGSGGWTGKVKVTFGSKSLEFDVKRTSLHFRDIHLDMDYTDKMVWPIVELANLASGPAKMENRKIDPFTAFEDAGLKLHYDKTEGDKVEDPTPDSPWTKGDLYTVMLDCFDKVEDADSNIWCLLGKVPPDEKVVGFSFDREGKHGFALFLGHKSFEGYESDDAAKKARAHRRLLHCLIRECGQSLGLSPSYETDNAKSLSWMNSTWRYDAAHYAGSFYEKFEFRFSNQELAILRHAPGKDFRAAADSHVAQGAYKSAYGSSYATPDTTAADDSDDTDDEQDSDAYSASYGPRYGSSYASSGSGYGTGSGAGTGYGAGSGTGSGYGAGSGAGSGYGAGSGAGSGYGAGSGAGSGYGSGQGTGSGYGAGSGAGSGYGSGQGTGSGYGSGYGGAGSGSGYGGAGGYGGSSSYGSSYSSSSTRKSKSGGYGTAAKKTKYEKPNRKIELQLQTGSTAYKKGQLVDYAVKVKNVGKLPALIEGDLSPEGGNLVLYVSKPNGVTQRLDSYARPIKSANSKPRVLYTDQDDEGSDRYSESGVLGDSKTGYIFNEPGEYFIKAKYSAGRYNVTSKGYKFVVEEPDTDDEYDAETTAQISEMAQLGGSSSERFKKGQAFLEKLSKKPVEKKKGHVAAMVALLEGMSKPSIKTSYAGDKKDKSTRKLEQTKPARPAAYLLKDTDDLIAHYHAQGEVKDNRNYGKLVMARAKLYAQEGRKDEAEKEVNQLYGDLMDRQVKYEVLGEYKKEWKKIKAPKAPERKYTAEYNQSKVNKVLNWGAKSYGNGEKDITGLGLGMPFSNFDPNHQKMVKKVTDMIFNKYEETQDVAATLKYAGSLQKGRETNEAALKYAVEAFIVHSGDAKKAGIRYPDPTTITPPPPLPTIRASYGGVATESLMNYWRMDADFNHHHRHWHQVYNANNRPHHRSRGELFAYMHAQMLARYDAERETWGLDPVRAYQYGESVPAFDAGDVFHGDPRNSSYRPRLEASLPPEAVKDLEKWEAGYAKAVRAGPLHPNLAGALLETCLWTEDIGNIHNMGHVYFSQCVDDKSKFTYMGSSDTAVRDPCFFRWHKRVDDLWQADNEWTLHRLEENETKNATIQSAGIAITNSPTPPNWDKYGDTVETIKTSLNDPQKLYEMTYKLDHEKFYYHIKLDNPKPGKVTVRIFICPEKHADDRRRWIEMDKFVHRVTADLRSATITRADTHSSVIRRRGDMYKGAMEDGVVETVEGHCDCGWPYNLLLPRGSLQGQKYKLCVVLTDTEKDLIRARTKCGSMSFCGADGLEYPDKFQMGYPFSSVPVDCITKGKTLTEVLSGMGSVALKTFVIKNELKTTMKQPEPDPDVTVNVWPTMEAEKLVPTGNDYKPSTWTGTFRMIIYHEDIEATEPGKKIRVSFSGRGTGNGNYSIKSAKIAARDGETDKIIPGSAKPIHVKENAEFTVPEDGIVSDGIDMSLVKSTDYFVTFTLTSPGAYTRAGYNRTNSLIVRYADDYDGPWSGTAPGSEVKVKSHLYCVKKIIA